jgi:DNA-binding GntR family transcriptional regulator
MPSNVKSDRPRNVPRDADARNAIATIDRLSAKDASQYTSLSEFVYQRLRSMIERGDLRPGRRVMESELAANLGVSRTPVREALRRLESSGMLNVESRVGLVVASISRQAMLELYVMREVMEGTAARLCAINASGDEILQLETLISVEKRVHGNPEEQVRHNRKFHAAVYEGAHNRYLQKSIDAINESMWLLGKSQMLQADRAKAAMPQHRRIVEAIKRRDGDAAEAAAREHVSAARQLRLKSFFPDMVD